MPRSYPLGIGGVVHDEVFLPFNLVLLNADLLHPAPRVTDDVGELVLGDGERSAIDPDNAELHTGFALHPYERIVEPADRRDW